MVFVFIAFPGAVFLDFLFAGVPKRRVKNEVAGVQTSVRPS